MGIKLFKMDAKCAFLNSFLNEEVYLKQPLDLKVMNFQIMFLNFIKLFVVENQP